MGIASTMAIAAQARDQLRVASQTCESSADAVARAAGVLSASEDTSGPLVAGRDAAVAFQSELMVVSRELAHIADELDRFTADLDALQSRIAIGSARSDVP